MRTGSSEVAKQDFPAQAVRAGLPERVHDVHCYRDDISLINELDRLIGGALLQGRSAVVIATEKHRKMLASALKARDINLSEHEAQGRYVCLDAEEALSKFLVNGRPNPVRFGNFFGIRLEKLSR